MTLQKNYKDQNYQNSLLELQKLVIGQFDKIIDEFGLTLKERNNMWIGPCPIHKGNNSGAFNIYKDGYNVPGYWTCHTHQCQKHFGANVLGFVRALLSIEKYDWESQDDPKYGFKDTIKFLEKLYNVKLTDYHVPIQQLVKNELARDCIPEIKKSSVNFSADVVKSKLEIPDPYFISRGFSPDILTRFMVGFCNNPKSPLYRRSVCPILDEEGKTVIGFTARSNNPSCPKCENYHDPDKKCDYIPKWINRGEFKNIILYNYSNAKDHIKNTKVAILVEGQGDVWKLAENNIQNVVGIFGTSLSDNHQFLLEKSGAMALIVLLDNDEAGRLGTEKIIKKCYKSFRILTYNQYDDKKDVGDFSLDQINSLKSFIHKIENLYK